MDVIGIIALVVSLAVWLFDPGPVRRFLRLEKPLPGGPYYVDGLSMEELRSDPKVAAALPAEGTRCQWTVLEDRGRLEAMGWRPVCVARGREIRRRSRDVSGTRESVLLVEPSAPTKSPAPKR